MSVYEYLERNGTQGKHIELWEESEEEPMEYNRIPLDADTVWREVRHVYSDYGMEPVLEQIYV